MPSVTAREPRRRRLAAIAFGIALGVAIGGTAALALWPRRAATLPVLGTLPSFELTDERGQRFALGDLRGQVFAASFVFTRCQTICPVIVGKLSKIQDATRDLGPALRLVSFSVDPEHDTPPVLAAFAREHRADARRWTFLTGEYDALQETVVRGFKTMMERGADGKPENILHGSHVVLVDGAARIRGYYDAADRDCVERVVRDARALVERADWAGEPLAGR
jgi:protein SCO1/2